MKIFESDILSYNIDKYLSNIDEQGYDIQSVQLFKKESWRKVYVVVVAIYNGER